MDNIRKCLEYARRAKSEGNIGLHRFYLQKARQYVLFFSVKHPPFAPTPIATLPAAER